MLHWISGISARISAFQQQQMTLSLTQILIRTWSTIIMNHLNSSPSITSIPHLHPWPITPWTLWTLKLNYGYSTPLVDILGPTDHTWEKLLLALGFVQNLHELSVSKSDKHGIHVFSSQIAKNLVVSSHLFDLHPKNYNPLEHLFNFADIQQPSKDLFVFFSP